MYIESFKYKMLKPSAMNSNKGFLTIAYGNLKYIQMATALARSIRLHSPSSRLAVVTDRSPNQLDSNLFDFIIPINLDYPPGLAQKLYVDKYTPFQETIFIDSDCIVYKDISEIWSQYQNTYGFAIKGWSYLRPEDGEYYAIDNLIDFFTVAKVNKIPLFNSGVFYFSQTPQAEQVFETARAMYSIREKLSLTNLNLYKNSLANDEPIFALAMEKNNIPILTWDEGQVMSTPSGCIQSQYRINVLKGKSQFKKNGNEVDPYIIHYHVDCSEYFIFWREIFRLLIPYPISFTTLPDLLALCYIPIRRRKFYLDRLKTKIKGTFERSSKRLMV